MRRVLGYNLQQVGAAVLVSCFTAAGMVALTGWSVADAAKPVTVSVNRINKGDRLPLAPALQQPSSDMSPMTAQSRKARLGCDPAFSPIVDPRLTHVVLRCMV